MHCKKSEYKRQNWCVQGSLYVPMWQAVKIYFTHICILIFKNSQKYLLNLVPHTIFRVYGSIFWRNLNRHFLMKSSHTEKFVLLLLLWVIISFLLSILFYLQIFLKIIFLFFHFQTYQEYFIGFYGLTFTLYLLSITISYMFLQSLHHPFLTSTSSYLYLFSGFRPQTSENLNMLWCQL